MFWNNFYNLCILRNTTPNSVCKKLNLSTATATHWKNGTMPKADVLYNIANLLNCSVDYLLGRVDKPDLKQLVSNDNVEISKLNVDEITSQLISLFKELSFKDKVEVMNLVIKLSDNVEKPL